MAECTLQREIYQKEDSKFNSVILVASSLLSLKTGFCTVDGDQSQQKILARNQLC